MSDISNIAPAVAPLAPARRRRRPYGYKQHVKKLGVGNMDGRSKVTKRVRQLAGELEREVGGAVGILQKQCIERAAMAAVISEDLHARRLRGEQISMDEIARAEELAASSLRAALAGRRVDKPAA
jgi:hypothetical protein